MEKKRYNCEVVRTCEDGWYFCDNFHHLDCVSTGDVLYIIKEKLAEIMKGCEADKNLGTLFVDLDFHMYKPIKKHS